MCSTFLSLFQNGSNLVESFLNIIRSYAETPGIFDFKKDQLVHTLQNEKQIQCQTISHISLAKILASKTASIICIWYCNICQIWENFAKSSKQKKHNAVLCVGYYCWGVGGKGAAEQYKYIYHESEVKKNWQNLFEFPNKIFIFHSDNVIFFSIHTLCKQISAIVFQL